MVFMTVFLLLVFPFCPFIQQVFMEHPHLRAIAPEVVIGPGPLCILRETPEQSDSTVNSDVLDSVLRGGGIFLKLIFQMVSPY